VFSFTSPSVTATVAQWGFYDPYMAQTQHLNHEPQTAWNTLPLNELQYGNFLGHGERLFGVS
jgi:hypothetical protein